MRRRSLFRVSFAVAVLAMIAVAACVGPLAPAAKQQTPVPATTTSGSSTTANLSVAVAVSKPANGQYLASGEKAVVTVTLSGKGGAALSKDDFATLNLYAYGPQETTKTVTAVKLLNASTDRSKTPHHYIDLLKDANVKVEGNTLTYALQPVSNEEPGTYTASVWAVKKGNPPVDQVFDLTDFQVGTATVEKQIVERDKCASCHQGASNGQLYLHHTQVSATNPYGNPSLDSAPVRSCKSCHNNDGYSAYSGNIADPTAPNTVRTPDPIVRRVHGVHMGEDLKNTFNTDPKTGDFKDYTEVNFPANVKNCTICHVDDRWKAQPSREACGACHDKIWFGNTASMPNTFEAHKGGPQANDSGCTTCHPADTGGVKSVAEAHKVSQPMNQVDVKMTPPANGKFYTAGEKLVVTLVIKDDNGNPIDHTKVDNANFATANLFVYGPRENTMPVLTNTAVKGNAIYRASVTNATPAAGTDTKGWTFGAGDTFKAAINGNAPVELAAPVGLQTPNQVRDWLVANLSGVTVTATGTNVTIKSNVMGDKSSVDIYNSKVTDIMGWKPKGLKYFGGVTPGVTMEPYVNPGRSSYPNVDLRKLSDPLDYQDPNVARNAGDIAYQLYDVNGLKPGTYFVYTYIIPNANKIANDTRVAVGFMSFQVGTETEDKKIATNCTDCHSNTIWHLDEGPIHPEPFNPDYCKACHDYARTNTGNGFAQLGGTSQNGWSGYGAVPIARRVHMVHRGAYLEHSEQIYAGNPDAFHGVIFPQDIRNCEKCHDPNVSPAWKQQPSRLACMSCHDSDSDNAHAKLNTVYTNSADEWSSDRIESCQTCHGPGKEFAVDKVHNVANPYKPPYPREPEKK